MFTIEHHVGRLCEVRYSSLSVTDMSLYRAKFATLLQALPGKLVFVSDVRRCTSVSHEVEQQGTQLMRIATPRIERAAMLVSHGAAFGMQLLRASLLTDSSVRRVFERAIDLQHWLADVLTPIEKSRLQLFLVDAGHRS